MKGVRAMRNKAVTIINIIIVVKVEILVYYIMGPLQDHTHSRYLQW